MKQDTPFPRNGRVLLIDVILPPAMLARYRLRVVRVRSMSIGNNYRIPPHVRVDFIQQALPEKDQMRLQEIISPRIRTVLVSSAQLGVVLAEALKGVNLDIDPMDSRAVWEDVRAASRRKLKSTERRLPTEGECVGWTVMTASEFLDLYEPKDKDEATAWSVARAMVVMASKLKVCSRQRKPFSPTAFNIFIQQRRIARKEEKRQAMSREVVIHAQP